MKLLVILAAIIALSSGSAIPLIPGDNSHYVEGESRYIWMPNGAGEPQLVDLQEPVNESILRSSAKNGAANQYWLYTRANPTQPQILVNGDPNSVQNSNYNPGRELKVIVHGWRSDGNSEINPLITSAFLSWSDVNVIVVDWNALADEGYLTAGSGVPNVGQHLGSFVWWLVNTFGGNWNNVHLVGFSLGAHIVGNAGRTLGGRAARVTGLDAAGPFWEGSPNALNKNDGIYVEAIHTDVGVLGLLEPIGDVDFYPNGGRNPMPGCLINTCSHSRAYQYFAASVQFNHLLGYSCYNLEEAQSISCSGDIKSMGNGILSKRGHGIFGLTTRRSWPF